MITERREQGRNKTELCHSFMGIPIRIVCAAIIGIVLAAASLIRIRVYFYFKEIDPYVDPYKYWTLEVVIIMSSIAVVINTASGSEDAVKAVPVVLISVLYTVYGIVDAKRTMREKEKRRWNRKQKETPGRRIYAQSSDHPEHVHRHPPVLYKT